MVSASADRDVRDIENEEYKAEYLADMELYAKRKVEYQGNLVKAAALLWEQCTKGMQSRIANKTEYATEIKNNPIRLLQEISKLSVNAQDS